MPSSAATCRDFFPNLLTVLNQLLELIPRYGASLRDGWWSLVLAGVVVTLFGLRGYLPHRFNARATWLCVGGGALFAVGYAWQLRWLGDDAFISFRYADNWARGHGLVFNPGERVEGYTNFLWTALMALGITLRLDPAQLSIVLTLASLAATLVVTSLVVRRLAPGAILPGVLAGFGLAANYTFASFGTSGLETVPAALLVLLALERGLAGVPWLAGLLAVLAGLAHPDHMLLYAALGVALVLEWPLPWRRALAYGAPLIGVFLPFYLARWAYYGDFFPNTYYAKSGGSAYFSQGFAYLTISSLTNGLVFLLPLAGWAAARRWRAPFGRFVLLGVPLYLAYVAKIGGDFMLGRLLCAVMPPLCIAAELGLRDLQSPRRPLLAALGLASFVPLALPNGVIPPQQDFVNVCDERTWYPLKRFSPIRLREEFSQRADAMLSAFREAPRPPRLAFCCVGIIGYRTGYYILDQYGLTSREVARIPIETRGRTGHEKSAGPGFSFETNVDFAAGALWPEPYESWVKLGVGGFEYSLAKYDPAFLGTLGKELQIPAVEQRIRDYSVFEPRPERKACDLWFFEQLYFSHQPDPALKAGFSRRLIAAQPELAALEALLFEKPGQSVPGFQSKRLFGFDDFSGWRRRGNAFEAPTTSEAMGQSRVFGHTGRFVNSFHPKRREEATGSMASPEFVLEGDALVFRIAGGMQPEREEVRLVVDGESVARATGCDSELLGRRIFATSAWRGRKATLEIVDAGQGAWGHVLVDEVVEWRRRD